ncbi:MAG: hypothetical protein ACO3QA_12685, partial [Phycisphaerales bacterium]
MIEAVLLLSVRAIRSIARRVIVVDSESGDGTVGCCEALDCEVIRQPWHGHEESGSPSGRGTGRPTR